MAERARQLNGDQCGRAGVLRGVVVVVQRHVEVGGHGRQSVVGQSEPFAADQRQGAGEPQLGYVDSGGAAGPLEGGCVELGVVGHERQVADEVEEGGQPLREGGLVGDVLGGDAVDGDVARVEGIQSGRGSAQPGFRSDLDAVDDADDPELADRPPVAVGGLDVETDEVQARGGALGAGSVATQGRLHVGDEVLGGLRLVRGEGHADIDAGEEHPTGVEGGRIVPVDARDLRQGDLDVAGIGLPRLGLTEQGCGEARALDPDA